MIDFASLFRQVRRKKKKRREPVPDIVEYTLPSVSWNGTTLEQATVRFPRLTEFAIWINEERVPFTPANFTDYGVVNPDAEEGQQLHKLLCYGVTFLVPEEQLPPFQRQLEHMAQGVEDYYARHIGIDM